MADHYNKKKLDWADAVVGTLSNWLELDSTDQNTRINSELVNKRKKKKERVANIS